MFIFSIIVWKSTYFLDKYCTFTSPETSSTARRGAAGVRGDHRCRFVAGHAAGAVGLLQGGSAMGASETVLLHLKHHKRTDFIYNVYISLCTYIYIYMCVYIYIYIYIYLFIFVYIIIIIIIIIIICIQEKGPTIEPLLAYTHSWFACVASCCVLFGFSGRLAMPAASVFGAEHGIIVIIAPHLSMGILGFRPLHLTMSPHAPPKKEQTGDINSEWHISHNLYISPSLTAVFSSCPILRWSLCRRCAAFLHSSSSTLAS